MRLKTRLAAWIIVTIVGCIAIIIAAIEGELGSLSYNGKGATITTVLMGYAWSAFIVIVFTGHIMTNPFRACSIKYIGWIYFLYIIFWWFGVYHVFTSYQETGKILPSFFLLTLISIPSVVLSVIFGLVQVATSREDESQKTA